MANASVEQAKSTDLAAVSAVLVLARENDCAQYGRDARGFFRCLPNGEVQRIHGRLAICFDVDGAVLHKHGAEEHVRHWRDATASLFVAGGYSNMRHDLVVWLVEVDADDHFFDEANKAVRITGYLPAVIGF